MLNSCHHDRQVKRSIYYWKTIFKLSQDEKLFLKQNKITRIYLHCFDVIVDAPSNTSRPDGILTFADLIPDSTEYVPVVYITNDVLKQTDENKIEELSFRILKLCDLIFDSKKIKYAELQIDCDWTDSTHKNYFRLLQSIKNKINAKGQQLSVTIRLHQVKYKNKTGVPPADQGMLMFYNMGDLRNTQTSNTIYDSLTASKYISSISGYPLPLDVALPIFTWGVQLKDSRAVKLLNNVCQKDIIASGLFKEIKPGYFGAEKGFFFRGTYFQSGDLLRMEEINPALSLNAAKQLSPKIKSTTFHVALYHLDESNTSRYETKDINSLYHSFE